MKPWKVIIRDIYSTSMHLDPVPLTYISRSIDFVRNLLQVKYYSLFLCTYDS